MDTLSDDSLSDIITALAAEVEHLFWSPGVRDTMRRRTARLGITRLVLSKHQEVLFILRRIAGELESHADLHKWMNDRLSSLPRGRISDPVVLGEFKRRTALTEALVVDIKSLYLWCGEIHDVYKTSETKMDLSELRRIKIVRNKLITHFVQSQAFDLSREVEAGVVGGQNEFKILLHSFAWNERMFVTPSLFRTTQK